jgi:clan AA aspartic protease (TIGR02281 family)
MTVHRAPFASTILLLVACALFPKSATAQYTKAQCTSILNALSQAMSERSFKKMVALERQNLTFCTAYMQQNAHVEHLGLLAEALNLDSQHQEALGVANNCLRISSRDLPCLLEKANALYHLGRLPEAKSVIEMSLSLGAITDIDVVVKKQLQQLLSIMPTRGNAVPSPQPSNQIPSSRANVPLTKYGGTFVVPVEINGAITLDFTLDSGATDVSIPADVFSTLRRSGTIRDEDISGDQTYVLADGSKTKSVTFTIRSLRVGNRLVENVRGSVASAQGSLLLGQSFLERFKSWSIDNTKHELVLEPR